MTILRTVLDQGQSRALCITLHCLSLNAWFLYDFTISSYQTFLNNSGTLPQTAVAFIGNVFASQVNRCVQQIVHLRAAHLRVTIPSHDIATCPFRYLHIGLSLHFKVEVHFGRLPLLYKLLFKLAGKAVIACSSTLILLYVALWITPACLKCFSWRILQDSLVVNVCNKSADESLFIATSL